MSAGANPAEIPGWTGAGNRGINPGAGAGTAFRDNGNNYGQVAFIQGQGSLSQSLSGFEAGQEYRLAFDDNGRNAGGDPGLSASIGDASLIDATVPPVGGSYGHYRGNLVFTAGNASETLAVEQTQSGDNTLLLDNFRILRTGPGIADNGFESPRQPVNNWKQADGGGGGDLTGSQWAITGAAGISRNRSAFQGTMYASEGEQIGLIQDAGSFAQTISGFEVGAEYFLSLLTAKRPGHGGNNLQVLLDLGLDSEIGLMDIEEVTYTGFTEVTSGSFIATQDTYDLTIRSSNPLGGDRTTFIDNVWFNLLAEAPRVIPEPSTVLLLGLGPMGFLFRRRRRA